MARPRFKTKKSTQKPNNPENLFLSLTNRAKSHGYLRGEQQEVLRNYSSLDEKIRDVALELPTGTGKTCVGLLIAEFHRRTSGKRAAYVTPTNQLASQVLAEAEKLGLKCANLIGSRHGRDKRSEGLFQAGESVAVTSIANLFNSNPIIKDCGTLVIDDAHTAEATAIGMWSVYLSRESESVAFQDAAKCLKPILSSEQYRAILNPEGESTVYLADATASQDALNRLSEVIDDVDTAEIAFPWARLRSHLNACLILASNRGITIRPLIPPTHTHEPFASASRRIYLSATFGGEGELSRGFSVKGIAPLKAEKPQTGRRFIFVPGLYLEEDETFSLISNVWKRLNKHRALLLAPSFKSLDLYNHKLDSVLEPKPQILGASDIENSTAPFLDAEKPTILGVAGRYDGLDLPDDSCRLLLLAGAPVAINSLERNWHDTWRLGPVMRRRARTRFVQALGRCVRGATDHAIVIALGSDLQDELTRPVFADHLPNDVRLELDWGKEQSKILTDSDGMSEFVEMLDGLLSDSDYRSGAEDSLQETELGEPREEVADIDQFAIEEVNFGTALWDGDYSSALDIARGIADAAGGDELAGYRAWWWQMSARCADILQNVDASLSALQSGRQVRINPGWFDHALRRRGNVDRKLDGEGDLRQAERIWNYLQGIGWKGAKFSRQATKAITYLGDTENHKVYHEGAQILGFALGAESLRPNDQGDPDVVWHWPGEFCLTIECKTEKTGKNGISKTDVQQAAGHVDWAVAKLELKGVEHAITPLIVAPEKKMSALAEPFTEGLKFLDTDRLRSFAEEVFARLGSLRNKYHGSDFANVVSAFDADVSESVLSLDKIRQRFSEELSAA